MRLRTVGSLTPQIAARHVGRLRNGCVCVCVYMEESFDAIPLCRIVKCCDAGVKKVQVRIQDAEA